jgi:hypothetical protein
LHRAFEVAVEDPYASLPDSDLAAWFDRGEGEALNALCRRHYSGVFRLAYRLTHGVSMVVSLGSSGWQPPFGGVGRSGRKYYFVPPDHRDSFVEIPTDPTWADDGLGAPAGGAGWVRFKGIGQNILNKFLDVHRAQGSPGVDLELLRQD